MKKIILLLALGAVYSCASNSDRKFASTNDVKLEDDYNWVESLDFDKKSEAQYKPESDEFKLSEKETIGILNQESLSRLTTSQLEQELQKEGDPLFKFLNKCYQGKFEEAFIIADGVYLQYKNNPSYWNQMGTCFYLKSDYSKAILYYNKSRDLDSKYAPAINNLGVVFQKQGRFQKSLSAYKKANEMNAFSVTPAFNLARIYLQFGIVTKAEPILLGLNKKNSSDMEVVWALSNLYLIKHDFEKAVNFYQQLNSDFLKRPEIGAGYSVALRKIGKIEEAKKVWSNMNEASGELKQYISKLEEENGEVK